MGADPQASVPDSAGSDSLPQSIPFPGRLTGKHPATPQSRHGYSKGGRYFRIDRGTGATDGRFENGEARSWLRHWLDKGLTWPRAAGIALALLLVANSALVLGTHTARWDASDLFCPYYMLIADYARHGQIMLWNPLTNGGCPEGFQPQLGAFSPVTVGAGLLTGGSEVGFRLYWLGLWFLGGLGMLLLARQLGGPTWVGCVAAIGYMFSPIYVNHAQHTTYFLVMSWFPWVIWRLDVAMRENRWAPAAQAGALWGLSALGGDPNLIVAGGFFAAMWALGRVMLCSPVAELAEDGPSAFAYPVKPARKAYHFVLKMALFSVVGILVLLPQYAGFMIESRGYSDRGWALPREIATGFGALNPAALSTLASPYICLHAKAGTVPLWDTDVAWSSLYMTPVLLVLALAGGGRLRADRFRVYLWVLALIYLGLAVGHWLPLRGWLYDWAPPTRYYRWPTLFRLFTVFTLVVLAVLSARDFQKIARDAAGWKRLTLITGVLAVLATTTFALVCWKVSGVENFWPAVTGMIHLVLIWGGLFWIAYRGWFGDESLRHRLLARNLIVLVLADAVLTTVISKPTMYTSRKEWKALDARRVDSLDLTAQGLLRMPRGEDLSRATLNGQLPLKIPVLDCYTSLVNHYHQRMVKHPILAGIGVGADRTWFAPDVAKTLCNDDSLERLIDWSDRHGQACLVVTDPDDAVRKPAPSSSEALADIETLPALEPVATTTLDYQPNHLVLDVQAPARGWVLVTDRWASGWQVLVNGHPKRIWLGNLIYRAVEVDAGQNRIEFTYRPAGYPWLLGISWVTLGVSLLGLGLVRTSVRRKTEIQPEERLSDRQLARAA